jgi:methionine synthase II (cobalamin-independent)
VVAAWRHADAGTNVLTKQVLPGPWSASLATTQDASDRVAVVRDLIEVLSETGRQLVAAGCPMLQVDEPAATRGGANDDAGDDGVAAVDLRDAIEALVEGLPEGASICLGLPDGTPRQGLWASLAALPVQGYLVDITPGADAWCFIARLPPEKGVVVGAIDARSREIEDPEMLVWAATLAAEMGDRGVARVGVSASGSLAGIDRHRARRKMEQAGMAVRLAAMGPLGQVARALQPDPATCRIRGLPELISAWQVATEVSR